MKLNKGWRIGIGIITLGILFTHRISFLPGSYAIGFMDIQLTFSRAISIQQSDPQSNIMLFYLVEKLVGILYIALIAFYYTHLIKNKTGLENPRIIFAVGFAFLPIVSTFAYYFVYVLPERSPVWVQNKKNENTKS